MEQTISPMVEEVRKALDGRTQRWLALQIKMPETDLSKKMNGAVDFTEDEIKEINTVLKSKIKFKA